MMSRSPTPSCVDCQKLRTQVASLEAEVTSLREQLAAARKDSTNSSKPPSSDIVKPKPEQPDGSPRTIGGQPGHPKHERPLFPPERVTSTFTHALPCCPDCGGPVERNENQDRVVQQVDVPQPPLTVEQHTFPRFWCPACRRPHYAPMPAHIERGGLAGPQLTALIAFMKGACHASFSTIRTFLRDVVGVTISRGQLAKILTKVTEALDQPYEELLRRLPTEPVLNVDETGHKDNGDLWWTWCFRAELYTVFHIDPHRSADVLMDVLGKQFEGVLGCDYFSAYRRYMRECSVRLQFCLAHLIRDVKFLIALPDPRDRAYGERLKGALKNLFAVVHRREQLSPEAFATQLNGARDAVLEIGRHGPPTQHGQNMVDRFRKHGAAYFTFITTPGVEPTNNLAEQAIRFVVIDRYITHGTRSAAGRRFCERMWTVVASCVQQGRSVWQFVSEAVRHWFGGTTGPSLLPAGG